MDPVLVLRRQRVHLAPCFQLDYCRLRYHVVQDALIFFRNCGLSEKEVTRSSRLAAVASSVDHMYFTLPCARLRTEAVANIHLVMAFADIKLLGIKPC